MSNRYLEALELARQGDWQAAHNVVQNLDDPIACQIHGYLHRVEGDDGNARYWYNRAGVSFPDSSLDDELQAIFDSVDG